MNWGFNPPLPDISNPGTLWTQYRPYRINQSIKSNICKVPLPVPYCTLVYKPAFWHAFINEY